MLHLADLTRGFAHLTLVTPGLARRCVAWIEGWAGFGSVAGSRADLLLKIV